MKRVEIYDETSEVRVSWYARHAKLMRIWSSMFNF